MAKPPTVPSDAWATFFKTFQRLHQSMELELKRADLPNLEVYDILWTLEQASEHRLRFFDLAEQVYLARFNITRLCQRLQEQGLITKSQCPEDKRGLYAQLTAKGLKLRQQMWQVYGAQIQKKFSRHLSPPQHQQLIQLMHRVLPQE